MNPSGSELQRFVARRLEGLADPDVAAGQAAYMYGRRFRSMHPDTGHGDPFHGVKNPGVRSVANELRRRFPIATATDYAATVESLWRLPHREEKYLAVRIAADCQRFVTFDHIALYHRLITEGAWWDIVDGVASQCVGLVLLREREALRPLLDEWIDDTDLWIRRAALLAHLKHKSETDETQLFDHCRRRLHEEEFFIRKAIGWVLRQYSRSAPDAVRKFVTDHQSGMSRLTYREATRHLKPVS